MQQPKSLNLPASLPWDLFGFVRNIVLFFCRRIIFAPINFKLVVYALIIIVGSTLKYFDIAPSTYLSSKHNIFNYYFAKLGWGWSMILLVPFVYLTTLIYTRGDYRLIGRHLIRLLVATGVWYVIVVLFVRVEAATGSCKHVDMRGAPRHVCLKGGHEWEQGHDFSGHTFMLLYLLLVINEEVKSYDDGWKKKLNEQ